MASSTDGFAPPLNQIAFSVVDLRLTDRWFREGFGLLPAGGSRALMRGPLAANVQGLPTRGLDLLVAARPKLLVSARTVPVRAPDGQTDAGGFPAMRHRLHPHRNLGRRLRRDTEKACRTWQSAADQAIGRAGRAARLRPQPRRCLRRNHGRRPVAAIQPARAHRLPVGDPLGDGVGAPAVRCRRVFRDGHRPQGQHRHLAHARARGVVGAGGRHDGKQAVRRRRGADRGGAVPRSRWTAAAP